MFPNLLLAFYRSFFLNILFMIVFLSKFAKIRPNRPFLRRSCRAGWYKTPRIVSNVTWFTSDRAQWKQVWFIVSRGWYKIIEFLPFRLRSTAAIVFLYLYQIIRLVINKLIQWYNITVETHKTRPYNF